MLNVVFLNGSARANGNTARLIARVAGRLHKDNIRSKTINISELDIKYCLGCHSCEQTKKCVQHDDVESIYRAFEKADLVCIASPSYWGDVTGQLKVFFDRSTPYSNTIDGKSAFAAGKNGCALVIRAGGSRAESEAVLASIEHYYSHLDIEAQFSESFESVRSAEDLNTVQAAEKIRNFAEKINSLEQDSHLFVV